MEPIANRITRYLLRRIRRLAVLDLYTHATGAGLLTSRHISDDKTAGTVWSISTKGAAILASDRASARRLVAKALKRGSAQEDDGDFYGQKAADPWNFAVAEPGKASRATAASKTRLSPKEGHLASQRMLRLLREFLPAPSPVHVAVALLIARSVGASIDDLGVLREVLLRPNPVVLFKISVSGFERQVGLMLENSLIAAFWASLKDVSGGAALSAHYRESRPEKLRRRIITASGRASADVSDRSLKRQLSDVLLGDAVPLLIADETSASVRPQIAAAADIVFEYAGIDPALLADLLQVCCGLEPGASLVRMEKMAFDPTSVCLDDLALAVKPGRSLEGMLDTLTALSAVHREDGDEDIRGSGSSSSKRPLKGKSKAASVDIVQPEPDSSPLSKSADIGTGHSDDGSEKSSMIISVPSLRVETLAGYGEAKGWALDLKEDLPLWREGVIGWDEMSTKMLLSGPPGTGKTTYAKALCNTLQVPMIVSSVAWWLEPGYLGDVLQRMSATFEAARENAPCLVFIDEIDAIGSRGGGQGSRHDDYWTTIITRLLELLDGALKSEGVIVVAATNIPDRIDAALLRSGRLEKHVAIPSPDAEALAGILAHHLGSDLAAVLASAPDPLKAPAKNPASEPEAPQSDASKPIPCNADVTKGQAHV
jgi:hypothetical protein